MAPHSSILAWKIPQTEEPDGLQSMGSQRVGHEWTTKTHTHTHTVCRVSLFQATSPLDYKEIKPVHPKGNQPWVFTGRTDAKAETPILWPPHAKTWLIGKDSASLSLTISRSLPKFMSIDLVMPSNHLTVCPHIHVSFLAYPDCSGRYYQTYKLHAISWEWRALLMESHKVKFFFFHSHHSRLPLLTWWLVTTCS